MRPCQLVDGEPGVSPDVRLRPAFLLLRWFQAWPRLGCRGGPGPLSTRLGGLLRSVPIPETPQDLHTFRRQPCDAGHTSRVTLTYRGITQGRCQLDMATGANVVRLCQSLLWSSVVSVADTYRAMSDDVGRAAKESDDEGVQSAYLALAELWRQAALRAEGLLIPANSPKHAASDIGRNTGNP